MLLSNGGNGGKMKLIIFVFLSSIITPNLLCFRPVFGKVKKPNIVVFAVNQLGLDNLSKYWLHLENIKNLSEESFRFTHVYSNLYPVSSRAAVLTGRLPVKTGMLKGRFLPFTSFPSVASSGGLPLAELTVAEILKKNGYSNKFIGLWDQGLGRKEKFLPMGQGFHSWFGVITQHTDACTSLPQKPRDEGLNESLTMMLYGVFWSIFVVTSLWCLCFLRAKLISVSVILGVILYATNSQTAYIAVRSCVLYRDYSITAQPYNIRNITLRFTDESLGFIKSSANKHPFFLMVNHLALSRPLFSSQFFRNSSGQNDKVLDMLTELDWSVGSILRTVQHMNLTDNTIFVFTALSGEVGSVNNTLNGFVHNCSIPDNWEKQIRVPLFIKWPKMLGKTIKQTVMLMDIMPTVLNLTGFSYRSELLDGKSLVGLMNGSFESLRSYVFHYLDVTQPSAVTHNDLKVFYSTMTSNYEIVHHDSPLLFNITEDPQEMSPLPIADFSVVLANISNARDQHIENRTRKWISQFEHPILPWLFPCANFPYCHRRDDCKLKYIVHNGSTLVNN